MAFTYKGQLNGAENPVDLTVAIANSQTVAFGNMLKLQTFSSGGGVMRATAGVKLLGVCVGIVAYEPRNGGYIDLQNANVSLYDGTYTQSTQTYVASSDNMTDKKVAAIVRIDPNSKWENDAAGDLAAADVLKFFDITSYSQVADQDGADSAGAMQLISIDPDDASKGIWRIAESLTTAYAVN